MEKFYKPNPFIIDPIAGLYLAFFFLLWYSKFKDKRPHIDFRPLDIILFTCAYMFYFFVGIYK